MLTFIANRFRKNWETLLVIFTVCLVYYGLKTYEGRGARRRANIYSASVSKPQEKWVYDPSKTFPPEWYEVPRTPDPSCKPKKNLYFLRTHQTGTSSVTNIFYRYGQEHNLNFVMYPLKLHLNYPGKIGIIYLEDVKPEGGYNILCQYMRHRRMDALRILEEGAIFTTLLRNPVDQFLSVFHNFDIKSQIRNLQVHQNPYEEFFRDPHKLALMSSDVIFHLLQNSMSFDLGLSPPKYKNATAIDEFIETIDKEFHLVMILELLDESLVLLRRLMCWDIKEIIHVKLSVNNKYGDSISEGIREKILDWNSADVKLYNYFYGKMKKIVDEQDEDFRKEVELFKGLISEFSRNCYSGKTVPVYNGNKIGHSLSESHAENLTCKVLATDDITQTHIIALKQFKESLPPSDILMVRNHMQNLKRYNPAMLEWGDVQKVLHPEEPTVEKSEEL